MKILLVGGFLGSGKTSFILQLAHHIVEDLGVNKLAILENEIGEMSVDDKLLRGAGYEVRGLFSGCVCCTLAGTLPETLLKIQRELQPEWLIMEASGLAFPGSIRETIELLGLDCRVCCLADAPRWKRISVAMPDLVEGQLEAADLILVNKSDLVDAQALSAVVEAIKALRPDVPVAAISAAQPLPEGLFGQVLREA